MKTDKKILDEKSIIIFDTETMGFRPETDDLLQFSGIKYINGKEVKRKNIFIKPNKKMKLNPTKTISFEMVKDGLEYETALKEIKKFIGNSVLVAHNSSFDINFLNFYLDKYNLNKLNNRVIDTLKIARKKLKKDIDIKNHKLGTIIKHFKIPVNKDNLHNALYDCEMLLEVVKKLDNI